MQAVEALKILLDLPRPEASALLLINLLDFSIQRLPIDSAQGCALHGGCLEVARQSLAQAVEQGEVDLVFDRLEDAIALGFSLIDLREPDEVTSEPMLGVPSLCIPSGQVLARASEFASSRPLLVCASGQRSGHAARLLRAQGVGDASSLAGGLRGLRIPSG
jgi:sulfur-carrier protein adenylyltransferase/sulfurtransferase